MKQPILFRHDDTLGSDEALTWKDVRYRTVELGTEAAQRFPLPVEELACEVVG
jgi:hypothetical protein